MCRQGTSKTRVVFNLVDDVFNFVNGGKMNFHKLWILFFSIDLASGRYINPPGTTSSFNLTSFWVLETSPAVLALTRAFVS